MDIILIILAILVILFILYKLFRMFLSLLITAALVIGAYLTNPSIKAHQRAVQEKAEQSNIKVSDEEIGIKNYIIISFTEVESNKKIIGVGAFTRVYIFGDLKKI